MAEKPETRFRRKVIRDLRELPRTYFFSVQQVAIRGSPDICLCINGNFVALELKKDKKAKVAALQVHTQKSVIRANGAAFIAYPENWSDVYSFLKILACDTQKLVK